MSDCSSSDRLVGKFFTSSTPPSFAETEQSLRKQWVLSGDMTVQKLDDGDTFLFEFIQKNDKEKILKRRSPYNVNGVIIVIKDLNSSDMIDFTKDSFSVAVVGLPSYLCTNEYLPTLKSLIGDSNSVLQGEFDNKTAIYFQVDIDLTKPLRPGFYVDQNRFVEFKYWNLGDFCYNCGRIGHVKECCLQVKFPTERALTATLRTHVYGPWLRLPFQEASYEIFLIESPSDVGECDKSLSYPQFFIEVDIMKLVECNTITTPFPPTTNSIGRFRFPCSYLDTDSVTASKAYEVIRREIYENMAFSRNDLEHVLSNIPDFTASLVEQLKVMKEDTLYCDDKWFNVKLLIVKRFRLTHVDCETMLAIYREQLVERNISKMINKRVEKNENLLSMSSWEEQITKVISEMGFTHYLHHSYVSIRAKKAMTEAIQIEISSTSCTVPADRSTVCGLERFKVLGPDMDRLDPCVICAEEMFLAEEATILPCSHVFHSTCLEKWFRVGHKCPLCGFKLPSQK